MATNLSASAISSVPRFMARQLISGNVSSGTMATRSSLTMSPARSLLTICVQLRRNSRNRLRQKARVCQAATVVRRQAGMQIERDRRALDDVATKQRGAHNSAMTSGAASRIIKSDEIVVINGALCRANVRQNKCPVSCMEAIGPTAKMPLLCEVLLLRELCAIMMIKGVEDRSFSGIILLGISELPSVTGGASRREVVFAAYRRLSPRRLRQSALSKRSQSKGVDLPDP